jgi:hypothetical protein
MRAEGSTMERRTIDWELVEKDWRAGVKTKQQMAKEHGVSRAAMDKHFDKLGIERDLGPKIRAKADALVTQAAVTREVTPETAATEREIIEVNATMQSQIILAHRSDIERSRKLTMRLLDELEHQTEHIALYRELAEIMAQPDERGQDKRRELFDKAMTLASRTGTMKSLADALKTLVTLERQAFGIDEREDEGSSGIDDVIKRVRDRLG